MENKVDQAIITELETIVGEENVLTDPERIIDYSHDEFTLDDIAHAPDAVIKPGST